MSQIGSSVEYLMPTYIIQVLFTLKSDKKIGYIEGI